MIRKIDIANEALEIAGLVSSSNQAAPEMTSKAVKAVERAMVNLESRGAVTGYINSPSILEVDQNADSGLNPALLDYVIKYVAVDVCEALAAPFTGEIKQQSRRAYRKLLNAPVPQKAVNDFTPSGQGNQRGCYSRYNKYLSNPTQSEIANEN